MTSFLCQIQIQVCSSYFYVIDLLTLLLFLGVVGKSAQIFLESWLASAMEGPTPVSSLLHASTMIVSGAFLLQRFQPYIFYSFNGMVLITFVGALTAFFAGTIGLVTMDLKRIIAYSTCSQMGYLVFCIGIGNSHISFFHLFNHAFFKCLLFVAAGTLIHALVNEQDIRLMGGLFKLFPFTFILMFFASFSLMGLPFLSGYYSKEKILEYSFYIYNNSNLFAFWLGSLSAFLTSIYSMRLIFLAFFNFPNSFKRYYENLDTSISLGLNIVLVLLGTGTIFSGFLFEDIIIGIGNDWLFFTSNKLKIYNLDLHLGKLYLTFLTFYYTCCGILISFSIFINFKKFNLWFLNLFKSNSFTIPGVTRLKSFPNLFRYGYIFLAKRWYINLMYNRYGASVAFFLGYTQTFILLDKGFFEGISLVSTRLSVRSSKFLVLTFYRTFYFGEILVFLFLTLIFVFFYHTLSSDCCGFYQLIKELYLSNSLSLLFQSLFKIVLLLCFLIINFIFNIFTNLFSNEINMLFTSFAVPRKKRRVRARVASKVSTPKVYLFTFLYLIKKK